MISLDMTTEEYYTAPPDDVFNEIKEAAIKIWSSYDDTYGYATEKIGRIKDIENVKDNAWYMVAMFDQPNQCKLVSLVSDKTKVYVLNAMETQ